jgi:hypothetical protein
VSLGIDRLVAIQSRCVKLVEDLVETAVRMQNGLFAKVVNALNQLREIRGDDIGKVPRRKERSIVESKVVSQ